MTTELQFLTTLQTQVTARLKEIKPPFVLLPGINIAGGEFGDLGRPLGQGYIYPTDAQIAYWARLGMKIIRVPFRHERLQPTIKGDFSATDLAEIDRCVAAAEANGIKIILDDHNYGKRNGVVIEKTDLGNLFWRLADRYGRRPAVVFGIMNEPADIYGGRWRPIVDEVVKAIRVTGTTNLILVPGGGWDGAHDFVAGGNAAELEGLTDTNYAIEVHQYLNADNSGSNTQEYVAGKGATILQSVTGWARDRGHRLFLGEFGFAMPAGQVEASAMLAYMTANTDIWLGFTVWAAGAWWGSYPFSVEPVGGVDAPQVAVLKRAMGEGR